MMVDQHHYSFVLLLDVLHEPPSIARNGMRAIHYSGCLLGFLLPDSVMDNNFSERHSQTGCSHLALLNK